MMKNIGAVLGSVRLWMLVCAAAMYVLQGGDMMVALESVFLGAAGIGTLDKFGKSLGGK